MKRGGLLLILSFTLLFSELRANTCTDTLPRIKTSTLDSVTVVHKRRPVIQSARGATLDIPKLDNVQFLNLAQALKEIPGIDVDEEGRNILYLGQPVAITKDGVNMAGFADLVKNGLNAPALHFRKVTLNVYDLRTEGPSLSFIDNKVDEGMYGNASVTGGTNMSMANLSLSLAKRKHLLNLAPSFMKMYGPRSEVMQETSKSATNASDINTISQSGIRTGSYALNLAETFEIAQGKILNTSVSYRRSETDYAMTSGRQQWRNDTLFNHMQLNNTNENNFGPGNQSLTFNNAFTLKNVSKGGNSKRWDVSLELNKNNVLNEQSARPSVLKGGYLPASNFSNKRSDEEYGAFAMIAYELQHKKAGNIEAVLKYFNRHFASNQDYRFRESLNGPDSLIAQSYRINYQYAALLSSWDKQLRHFSLRAVLKADLSMDKASGYAARERFSFFTVAPYLSAFRETNHGSLRLELQYNRLRPQLNMLTSITRYGEEYGVNSVVSKGNPNLRPSGKWNISAISRIEAGATTVNITGAYAIIHDDIQLYHYLADSVMTSTYKNLAASQNLDLAVSAARYLFPRFQASIGSALRAGTFKLNDSTSKQTRLYWRQNLTLSYTLSPGFRMSGGLSYDGGYSFQVKTPARLQSNFSLAYVKGKFSSTLSIHNYHQPVMEVEKQVEGDGYIMHSENRSRIFRSTLMIAYRFGRTSKNSQKGKEIGKDDM